MIGSEVSVKLDDSATVIINCFSCFSWLKLAGKDWSWFPCISSDVRLVSLPISIGKIDNCVFCTHRSVSDCRLNSCTGKFPKGLLFRYNFCSCFSWKIHSGTDLNWLLSIDSTMSLGNLPKIKGNDYSLFLCK